MKKWVFTVVPMLLCMTLISCNDIYLPSKSKNFSEDFCSTFRDKYAIIDPQLAYMSASLYEANGDGILLTLIDAPDKDWFVSGTWTYGSGFGGGEPSGETYVYQSESAPTPMEDWTIKSVKLYKTTQRKEDLHREHSIAFIEKNVKEMMTWFTQTSQELIVVEPKDFEKGAFSQELNESFSESEFLSPGLYDIHSVSSQSTSTFYYYLVFTFEENSNIVWYSYLYWCDGYLLLLRQIYSTYYNHTSYDKNYVILEGEFSETLKEALKADGWEEREYTPGSPPAEPDYTKDSQRFPNDSELIPSDTNLPAETTPPGR